MAASSSHTHPIRIPRESADLQARGGVLLRRLLPAELDRVRERDDRDGGARRLGRSEAEPVAKVRREELRTTRPRLTFSADSRYNYGPGTARLRLDGGDERGAVGREQLAEAVRDRAEDVPLAV